MSHVSCRCCLFVVITRMRVAPEDGIPRSFVIFRGSVSKYVQNLVADFRRVMSPHTAKNLKVRPAKVFSQLTATGATSQRLEGFCSSGRTSRYHPSHCFLRNRSCSEPGKDSWPLSNYSNTHLSQRIGRIPRGPTLTFRVLDVSLSMLLNNQRHTHQFV